MKRAGLLMIALTLILAGCGGGPTNDKLIGKWLPAGASDAEAWNQLIDSNAELEIEFTADGLVKMYMTQGGSYFILTAAYKMVDNDTMKITAVNKEEEEFYIPGTEEEEAGPAKDKIGFWGITLSVASQEFDFSIKGDELTMSRMGEEDSKRLKKTATFIRKG